LAAFASTKLPSTERSNGLEDPYTVFLNVVLLFLVLFFVYPLKFVFTMLFEELWGHDVGMGFHEVSVLMRIYATGFAAVFIIFARSMPAPT